MLRAIPRALVLFVLPGAIACGKPPSSAETDAGATASKVHRVGSCDRAPAVGTCSEYASEYLAANEALVKSSCTKLGGTFVDAPCPNTSVVGACTLSSGEVRKYYGTGASAYDAARARAECIGTFHGEWR